MKTNTPLPMLILGGLLLFLPSQAGAQSYAGSDFCANCHITQHNEWAVSGHPWKLVPAEAAQNRAVPLPQPPLPAGMSGLTWDDVSYIIGGYKWKVRYIDTDGYIITSVDTDGDGLADTDGMNQYNMLTGNWVNYHAGELKPYNCGACHTTGWVPDDDWETDGDLSDNQDERPGMHGTFEAGGVHCEACHGPSAHFDAGYEGIDDSAAACGSCHYRGDTATIPAKGGFIRHHEQYNEQLASPHAAFRCVTCHNPHKKAEFSIEVSCEDCHSDVAASYAGTEMGIFGVECQDCHMPFASKSAEALGPYRGDVRTHLFRINTDADANLFTDDGGFVLLDDMGQAGVTLDFACLSCHKGESLLWAEDYARDFHEADGDGEEVCLCHIPPGNPGNKHEICIEPDSVDAHLAHGDVLDDCSNVEVQDNFRPFITRAKGQAKRHGALEPE